jgi:hypothetical protein
MREKSATNNDPPEVSSGGFFAAGIERQTRFAKILWNACGTF